ncbi:Enoyl-CoA hydratase/isomerase [Segniliparus rotundus DSM 44985]|uniref:Probable enoyl-CoA hydratase EchA17 n=1 Tax=Segniliparus rotundus (strain ATCC BAA-972 / CDC 1076 / CIP 108378 / DSM 44985 / JCM 13578) TaxID=640132 RepID=D6Z7A7_SEGRD|nr:enoyl-CoA hydratase-related protein [Segniliparus rotundus]ADG97837.1 Enoyl-CoA hydratase/isomerase [Segniliparus rotundus DSM 44985]
MAEFVTVQKQAEHPGVAVIRLDRPPMNALNAALLREVSAAADQVSADPEVRAVVVYGGEKVFAAGADIKEMATLTKDEMAARAGELQSGLGALARIPKPTVAAITGYALGGGLELALGADRRIAGDNVKVGLPEILLGVIPGGGGTQRLPRLIGTAKAKDLIFSGRFVGANEALQLGVVDEVVAPDEVLRAALEWASRFQGAASVALAAAKRAVDEGVQTSLDAGLALEEELFASLFGTEDRSIGMASFIENGPGKAKFVGR